MTEDDEKRARIAAEQERIRRGYAAQERADWAEMQHVYERCVAIAEKVWQEKIDTASAQQQTLAEQMRDRVWPTSYGVYPREIPVPLFTPRDRVQFVKEVATTLFIEAGSRNRNLTAKYKDPNGETELAATEKAVTHEVPVEAASGADETQSDAPLALGVETPGYGERVSEAPAPSL